MFCLKLILHFNLLSEECTGEKNAYTSVRELSGDPMMRAKISSTEWNVSAYIHDLAGTLTEAKQNVQ